MNYYAHSIEGKPKEEWQLLKDHLKGVAKLASEFANKFGAQELARTAGLLHDIGKYSQEFQEKLEGKKKRVDHSTAGAKEAIARYGEGVGKILAYVIAGHHCGLADYIGSGDDSCLDARLNNNMLPDYSSFKTEIGELLKNIPKLPKINVKEKTELAFAVFMLIRMVYSCLVDADFLDTEQFCDIEKSQKRGKGVSISALEEKLNKYLQDLISKVEKTEINNQRLKILQTCIDKAELPHGFFTLTVPTGGGKTFSSLAFALKHARLNNFERVIYVIPYTSIIEQNAEVFRRALGIENVLEHHSNYEFAEDENDEDSLDYKIKLAAENWDMPVVVTTNVQFFESLFSRRSSRCRKLHNIVKSVIILDEAQMLPVEYIKPCIYALAELIRNYNCSVIFCTATQPALFDDQLENFNLPDAIKPVEIIEKPKELYEKLKAVNVKWIGEIGIEKLVDDLLKYKQVLCIVNTRKLAKELYCSLKNKTQEGIYHLSAAMCPAHRTHKIKEFKEKLENKKKCIVISTQLIEAGVHIDFPVVFREIAGIDSIAQAAGRCNRERKIKEGGQVFVFEVTGRKLPGGFISRTAGVTKEVLSLNKKGDILSLENIKYYFEKLYSLEGDGLDSKNILRDITASSGRLEYPFRTISDNFNLIEDNTYSLIVPYDKQCETILNDLNFVKFPWMFARKLQRYTVQVYRQDYDRLIKSGMIKNVKDIYYVVEKDAYSQEFGINVDDSPVNMLKDYII